MQILSPVLFGTIAYWMIGFKKNGVNFLLYTIVVVLVANIGSALGLTLGIIAKDAGTASALIPMIILPFVIFSGFFVNSRTVPAYFIWVPPISFVKYAFSAVVLNEVKIEF
jgi:ABC-type multidrug transport system permease subunit